LGGSLRVLLLCLDNGAISVSLCLDNGAISVSLSLDNGVISVLTAVDPSVVMFSDGKLELFKPEPLLALVVISPNPSVDESARKT